MTSTLQRFYPVVISCVDNVSFLGLKSKSDAGCPLCTCPIVEHQGNSSPSAADVSSALPTDSVMEAIVESAGMLVKGDMCTVCDDVTAEYICMQCGEKMCPSCMKIHKKMIATRSHDVESVSTVTPERLAASRPTLCADHGDKQAEFFCADHRLVICVTCFSNKHNECPNIKHLDNEMKSAEKSLDLLTEKLAEGEDNLKQAIVNLNARIKQADVTELENMELVDKTCDRLHKMLDECRKQLKKLISDSLSNFKKSLCDVKIELEKRLEKVTSHKHLVTRATTVRPRPALIHAAKTLTDRVNSLDLSDELEAEPWVNPSPEITKYCDDVGKQITAELQNMELELAKFETTQAPVLVFHENCGSNVLLMNGQKTARRADESHTDNTTVVSRDAMAANVLYEVRIDEMGDDDCVNLGVTGIPPAQLNLKTSTLDLTDFITIWSDGVDRNDDFLMQAKLILEIFSSPHFLFSRQIQWDKKNKQNIQVNFFIVSS
ncbi:transcription intermediary factor 1-alpha-like isoform X2 [Pomacea canaliculata]|uniref:transcription intermediary factor 1-alpha-like isoform X2 n=1 Tax=Pomacea canaliculata TaxID=400727 RepID=UPI000D72B4AA|nr:transcription intermediary factor 1-alpha-like isoform X2 [Pomacea canaliculata]